MSKVLRRNISRGGPGARWAFQKRKDSGDRDKVNVGGKRELDNKSTRINWTRHVRPPQQNNIGDLEGF